jgi:hypothetical protein
MTVTIAWTRPQNSSLVTTGFRFLCSVTPALHVLEVIGLPFGLTGSQLRECPN